MLRLVTERERAAVRRHAMHTPIDKVVAKVARIEKVDIFAVLNEVGSDLIPSEGATSGKN
jgi:adenosyl cobinamide kinase/adenosyl cobinamide phosphate guanylyltransferase